MRLVQEALLGRCLLTSMSADHHGDTDQQDQPQDSGAAVDPGPESRTCPQGEEEETLEPHSWRGQRSLSTMGRGSPVSGVDSTSTNTWSCSSSSWHLYLLLWSGWCVTVRKVEHFA